MRRPLRQSFHETTKALIIDLGASIGRFFWQTSFVAVGRSTMTQLYQRVLLVADQNWCAPHGQVRTENPIYEVSHSRWRNSKIVYLYLKHYFISIVNSRCMWGNCILKTSSRYGNVYVPVSLQLVWSNCWITI